MITLTVTLDADDDVLDEMFPPRPAGTWAEGDDGATTAEVAASWVCTALVNHRARFGARLNLIEVTPARRQLPPEPLADRVAEFRSWVNRTLLGAGVAGEVVQFDDEDLAPWCGYVLGVHDDRPAA